MKISTPLLNTERLEIIPLSLNHASENYVYWLNDEEVNRFLESGGDYTMVKLKDFLYKVEKSEILFWAIHLRESGKHIGNIKIDPIDLRHRFAEYGILMGEKDEWGKGFAYEASKAVIDYCFSESLYLRKINLGVRSQNKSAIKLYERLGFVEEGRLKKHVITRSGFDDVLRMALFNPNHE